jgi:hypothetical protein
MNSAPLEFLRRVVTGILSFLMVPIALVLIPFGILLRVIAVAAGKKDLTFLQPSAEASAASAYAPPHPTLILVESTLCRADQGRQSCERRAQHPPSRVVLRTQNLGFIPHVSPVNGLAVPPKRAPAMLRDVKSGRDDIICLQELFDLTVIDRVVSIILSLSVSRRP